MGACILFSKRNLDSHNKNCIMIVTEPTTPLIFHAQPGGTFLFMGCFMYQYPKQMALRVRLVEALLIHGEPLVLQDSSIFKEKNCIGRICLL